MVRMLYEYYKKYPGTPKEMMWIEDQLRKHRESAQ